MNDGAFAGAVREAHETLHQVDGLLYLLREAAVVALLPPYEQLVLAEVAQRVSATHTLLHKVEHEASAQGSLFGPDPVPTP